MPNTPVKHTQAEDDELTPEPRVKAAKNYITPAGYAQLKSELLQLMDADRPTLVEAIHWAAKNGDRSENGDYIYGKRRLREVDKRIRFLTQRLEIAIIFDPSIHYGKQQVFFGCTVAFESETGEQTIVTILGADEANTLAGEVSWLSPVATALLKAKIGDDVTLKTPQGLRTLHVANVSYPPPASLTAHGADTT